MWTIADAPAVAPHTFVNSGAGPLHQQAIHVPQSDRDLALSCCHVADWAVVEVAMSASDLPEFLAILGQLPQLEQLDLAGYRLTALPDDIGDLPRLTRLILDDN